MAIDFGESAATIKRQERTCRVFIHTPLGGVPVVEIGRESVLSMLDGSIMARNDVAQVTRSLAQVAAQEITVRGVKLSGALMAEAIAAFADLWRSEDIAESEGKHKEARK